MAGVVAAGQPPRTVRAFTLRPRVLRTLLWLRWQLLVRGYARSTASIVGAVVLAAVLIPSALGLGALMVAEFQSLIPTQPLIAQNLLFYILTGLYLIYALLPLMQFNLNEGLDITKLTTYPLSQPELMASLLIATLLDIPTIAVLILFIGLGLGWAQNPVQGVAIGVALLLAYVHLIAISQLLLSALMGILRSRKFRDISLVLVTLIGLSISLGSQVLVRVIPTQGNTDAASAFIHYDIAQWLQFIPPGMAGRAIVAVTQGQWANAAFWLALLAVAALPVLWAWSAVIARGLATPEMGGSNSRTRARARANAMVPAATSVADIVPVAAAPTRPSLIPAPALAIAGKDLRYYWRDPLYKRSFLGSLYFVGIILLNFFTNPAGQGFSQLIVGAALFMVLNLTAYAFGYEGPTLTTLAFFPVRAVHLFLGRNLATLTVGVGELILLLALQGYLTQDWYQTAVLGIVGLGALLATIGPANVIAVFVPIRINRSGVGRTQNSSGTGCVTGLVSFLSYIATLLIVAPLTLILIIPQALGQPSLELVLAPLALLYGVGIYAGGTAIAASQYYERLPKIIDVVARE
jgi:ABC-2 type transport system permease protein